MVIWSLFDSGNGCYSKVANEMENIENYSIGIDRENKNTHFINLNLADYSRMFGDNTLFETLDKLPKPDLIIASPPCESWSNASSMKDGNACWKYESVQNLFGEMRGGSNFVVRDCKDYEGTQFYFDRQILTRINGELCIFNTIEIIKRYKPQYYIIENPAYGRIWEYIEKILGFHLEHKNLTFYNNYGFQIAKPERFSGNIYLDLKQQHTKAELDFRYMKGDYNKRSDIPQELVKHIFTKVKHKLENNEEQKGKENYGNKKKI